MHEVHRPGLVRLCGCAAILPQLRLDPPLRRLAAQLQPQLLVDPAGLLVIDAPALAAQQNVNAPVAVAHPRLADFPDPHLEAGLLRAARLVVVGRGVPIEHLTGPPDRHTLLVKTPSTSLRV